MLIGEHKNAIENYYNHLLMARSHQKYFTLDGHWMAIGQNGFLYNTIQHSHTSDAERMEIGFRQDRKYHVNKEKYITQHNNNQNKMSHKKTQI